MMFNFFLKRFQGEPQPALRCQGMRPDGPAPFLLVTVLVMLAGLSGCHTAPPLPPADLRAPGWEIREGQVLWKPRRDAEGIAGEILIAIQKDKRAFVQFSKHPFPIVTAGVIPNSWELEIPTQGKRYSRRGKPPSRLLWFQLLRAIAAQELPGPWVWTSANTEGAWRLENRKTGETLEGYFSK
jgi:hypothetical protein